MQAFPFDEMTPLERKRAMAAGKSFDRFPCVPFMGDLKRRLIGAGDWEIWNEADAMVRAERAAFLRWGYDRIAVGPNTRTIAGAIGSSLPFPLQSQRDGGSITGTVLGAIQAADPFDIARSACFAPFLQAIDRLVCDFGDTVPVNASIGGPATIASQVLGVEAFLRLCRRDRSLVQALLRLVASVQGHCIDKLAAAGATIAVADPVANPALIGHGLYEDLVFPVTMELCDSARRKCGEGVALHMCGKTECIWGLFARYPLGELSVDEAVDLDGAVSALGDSFALAGNVDPVGAMLMGGRREISQEVQRCIRAGRRSKKGFVLATGCDIPFNAGFEKIDMLMEECRLQGLGQEPWQSVPEKE